MNTKYDLHCEFDIEKHKETYINYLEVVITEDGIVHYAIPSHQEYLIRLAMKMNNLTRDELVDFIPDEYYGDVIIWLCKITNSISLWNDFMQFYSINDKQVKTLNQLKDFGLYNGPVPQEPMDFHKWNIEKYAIQNIQEIW